MMFDNFEKYFQCAPDWGVIDVDHARPLAAKHGAELVARLFSENDISVSKGDEDGELYDGYSNILGALKT